MWFIISPFKNNAPTIKKPDNWFLPQINWKVSDKDVVLNPFLHNAKVFLYSQRDKSGTLNLLRRRSLSYISQSIDLLRKWIKKWGPKVNNGLLFHFLSFSNLKTSISQKLTLWNYVSNGTFTT